jgi:hypothetical protein
MHGGVKGRAIQPFLFDWPEFAVKYAAFTAKIPYSASIVVF